jgi:uncharacterized membrane protein
MSSWHSEYEWTNHGNNIMIVFLLAILIIEIGIGIFLWATNAVWVTSDTVIKYQILPNGSVLAYHDIWFSNGSEFIQTQLIPGAGQ